MSNLYVVESPLQALCALEIALGKKGEVNNIIVRTSAGVSLRNDNQILAIVEKFDWSSITVIYNKPKISRYLTYLENIKFLNKIADKYKNKIDSLYIGEFNSVFMHMIRTAVKPSNVFLLDDGAGTLKVIKKYVSNSYNYPYDTFYPDNFVKRLGYKLLFSKYIRPKDLNKNIKVITAFSDEEADYIEKIAFKNLKTLSISEKEVDYNSVYYFGSIYSEINIISMDYELSVLNKVKDFYGSINKKVYYFAHRRESANKLKIISEKLGFEVVVSDKTAELYLLENEVLPYEIAGAFTSVLNNVKVIFPNIPLRSFRFKSSEIAHQYRDQIKEVYEHFASNGIPLEI